LTNDIILIIECCKISPNTVLIEKQIDHIKDWNSFISLAYSHGIFPLIYKTLKNYDKKIPSEILNSMKYKYMNIVKQNMLMTNELINVTKLLKENGIESIAFKGPVLSHLAYGDITLRQYVDLDILVDEKNVIKTYELLTNSNYSVEVEKSFLSNHLFMSKEIDITFSKNTISLELHWNLFKSNLLIDKNKINKLLDYEKYSINNKEIKSLKKDILFIYLCIHGSKHCWERLEWLNDINNLFNKYYKKNKNLEKLIKIAKLLEVDIILITTLNLVNQLFDTRIGDFYTNNYNLNKNIHNICNSYNKKNETEYEKNKKSFFFLLYLHKGYLKKTKFIFIEFFTLKNRDIIINLPKSFFFMYYIIKIIRLIKKYFKLKL